jgi:hypothetical protein
MFDFRYHALSLAAVLIALVVGLLLGAAIGDNSIFSSAERSKLDQADKSLGQAQAADAALSGDLALREQYEGDVYPTIVADELVGERIGLIFLGQDNNQIDQYVHSALAPSGAQVEFDAVVREPLELSEIASALASVPGASGYANLASDPALLAPFAEKAAKALVSEPDGGALIRAVEPSLFSSYVGGFGAVGAIVLVRNDGSLPATAIAQTAAFERAFATGLVASGVVVAGVQLTDTAPSLVIWYSQQQLSSVNDVDDIAGRTALVYVLAGARGSYGIGSGVQSLLPSTLPTGACGKQ